MKRLAALILFCFFVSTLFGQINQGEVFLQVLDPSGHGIKALVHVVSEASEYNSVLSTNDQGVLDVRRLPYGNYEIKIDQAGFAPYVDTLTVRSSLVTRHVIQLKLAAVNQSVTVNSGTLLDPEQAGAVSQIGTQQIEDRVGSIPGRSLQDLVNSQPGWLYEGNAVLHPRGSEYQTQFVVDGIPLTDDRSPSFGPSIDADGVQAISVYTAGIPAEYGRKMGGVIEVDTQQDAQEGFHGEVVLDGGSFDSAGAYGKGQYAWGKNTLGAEVSGSRTDHYLNPVVTQNYSNTGTLGDFAASYLRAFTPNDKFSMSVRHTLSRYDIPNEVIQQAAGQRQNADNVETMGIASYQHTFSVDAMTQFSGMVRDNSNDFYSNPASIPVYVGQHNDFRDGYFSGTFTYSHGRQEWKAGVESDNAFLHEDTCYVVTQDDDDNAAGASCC